jgi:hypothetical protein
MQHYVCVYRALRDSLVERALLNAAALALDRKKSWPHFRPSTVDFCCSRLAIGAATERARALAMPAGTRAQALQTRL